MLAKTALIILSCDNYSELWDTHFQCLDKYWPDCPFPKYILTNHKEPSRTDIKAIKIGDDLTWSANLKKALKTLRNDYEFVLVTFDDLFLVETVKTVSLSETIDSFHALDGQFLQLIKWYDKPLKVNSLLGKIEPGSLYRPNCVWSLWDIAVLDDLLLAGENAWEFEKQGSARSDRYNGFYVVLDDVFHYRNTVVRGKILRKDARQFQLKNTVHLKVMSIKETIQFYIRYWGMRMFFLLIPRKNQIYMSRVKNRILGKAA